MCRRLVAFVFVPIACAVLVSSVPLQADLRDLQADQSTRELFERARMLEESNNKLADAIELYAQVVSQSADRQLAATAQLRIGLLHERLGQPAQAQQAFRTAAARFQDVPHVAREAASRVAPADSIAGPLTRPVHQANDVVLGSVSPDGRVFAFTDWDTGDIAVRDVAGGRTRRLTNKGTWQTSQEFGEFPVVSRDGRRVVYTWWIEGGGFELRLAGVERGETKVLCRSEQDAFVQAFDWSPDGRRIAAVFRGHDRTHQIALVDAQTGARHVIKTLDWRAPWKMAFSHDGRFIAYDLPAHPDAPERDILIVAVDGSREAPAVAAPAHDVLLGWFPGRSDILFASDRGGTTGAWMLHLEDGRPAGEPVLVKPSLGHVLAGGFTQKGDYYYFLSTARCEVAQAPWDPAAGTLAGSLTVIKTRAGEGRLAAAWSPDGAQLAYLVQSPLVRGGDGADAAAIQTLSTGQIREIPLKVSYATALAWTAGGDALVIRATDLKGRRGLYRIDLRTGGFEPLMQQQVYRFSLSPDSRRVFFPSPEKGGILSRELASGEEHLVAATPSQAGVAASPDGRWIAVHANLPEQGGKVAAVPSIQLVPAAGGAPRTLVTLTHAVSGGWRELAWTPDSRFILYTDQDELWRVGLDGSPLKLADGLKYVNQISVHPGGRSIAVSSGSAKYQTWVMENLLTAGAVAASRKR